MEDPQQARSSIGFLALLVSIAGLVGCNAHTDVGTTGAAPADATHMYVTVDEVSFASAADTAPESTTGWIRKTLSHPVVIDLASLEPGSLVTLANNLSIPAGSYLQMHLGLVDSSASLVSAARSAGLDYNAQVDVVDSSGKVTTAALELAVPGEGLTFPISLSLSGRSSSSSSSSSGSGGSTSSNTTLAVTVDGARDLVAYDYGSRTGYMLSPTTSVGDEKDSGAITGSVDAGKLATSHGPITVSAESLDDSSTHHVIVQRRLVDADGSFTIYPLPASKQGSRTYDLVITCADADTVIVRDAPATAGAVSLSSPVQPTPIVLSPAQKVYVDVGTQSPAIPAGARVEFYQTLPGGGEVPYLIDGTAVDPLTRQLPDDAFALAGGSIVVGTYAAGGDIAFKTVTPAEGTGGYVVGTSGLYRADTLASDSVVVSGTSSRPTVVPAPYPTIVAGGRAGTLTVSLQAPTSRFDSGLLLASVGNRIVEAADVGTLLAKGGGLVILSNLPAGSTLVPTTGVPYRVSLRAWNSRNAAGTLTSAGSGTSVTLGDFGSSGTAIQIQ
jgi:hypothetical protein